MKRLLFIVIMLAMGAFQSANAQELYQYAKDSVFTTNVGNLYIIKTYSSHIKFSNDKSTYEPYEPSTCSDSTIECDEYGRWIVDKTRYGKPSQDIMLNAVKIGFSGYYDLLKSTFEGGGKIWICIRTDSYGVFKNAEVKIWAEPSIYRQIPPEVLCRFLNVLDDFRFAIPPEYQCISDHYFHYSVFFKEL